MTRWGWHLCHPHCPAPRKGQGICSLDASSLGVCWLNKPNPARARVKCLDSSSLDYKGESMEKLKRGQKMCKNCSTINGVRSFNCKNCNHPRNKWEICHFSPISALFLWVSSPFPLYCFSYMGVFVLFSLSFWMVCVSLWGIFSLTGTNLRHFLSLLVFQRGFLQNLLVPGG